MQGKITKRAVDSPTAAGSTEAVLWDNAVRGFGVRRARRSTMYGRRFAKPPASMAFDCTICGTASRASVPAGGLSLAIIGALLGHKHATTTARYAHLSADPLRAANDAVGARIAPR